MIEAPDFLSYLSSKFSFINPMSLINQVFLLLSKAD